MIHLLKYMVNLAQPTNLFSVKNACFQISEPHGENPALDYTFPVHFLDITLILHWTYKPLVLD